MSEMIDKLTGEGRMATIREVVGGVQLVYREDDRTRERVFYTSRVGTGYVREEDGRQVCEGLYSTGRTLEVMPGRTLLALIRREWRRHQREERKAALS